MLENLNLEEILFIDIETVPLINDFNGLSDELKNQFENKMNLQILYELSAGDLYHRAGIYDEFG
jgi:hypothetical protein